MHGAASRVAQRVPGSFTSSCRRFEVPAVHPASYFQGLQMETRHEIHSLASALDLPKSSGENRGKERRTSGGGTSPATRQCRPARYLILFKYSLLRGQAPRIRASRMRRLVPRTA